MRNMTITRPTPSDPPAPPAASACSTGSVAILDIVEPAKPAASPRSWRAPPGLVPYDDPSAPPGLEAHDLLDYVGARGYHLGPRLLKLRHVAPARASLRDVAHPALERLAATTGESAQLYVPSIDGRLCVDAVESSRELRTFVRSAKSSHSERDRPARSSCAMLPEQAERPCARRRNARRPRRRRPTGSDRQIRHRSDGGMDGERGRASKRRRRRSALPSAGRTMRDDRGGVGLRPDVAHPSRRRQALRARGHGAAATDIERALGYQA